MFYAQKHGLVEVGKQGLRQHSTHSFTLSNSSTEPTHESATNISIGVLCHNDCMYNICTAMYTYIYVFTCMQMLCCKMPDSR